MRLIALFLTLSTLASCSQCQEPQPASEADSKTVPTEMEKPDQKARPVEITEIEKGEGEPVEAGKTIQVHYVGMHTDGQKFDSSHDRGEPFEFVLGSDQVIKGWNDGVAGMRVGGKRRILVPSHLAYGERGVPGIIPPESDILFEVEIIAVK